jgi:hypothetical protein
MLTPPVASTHFFVTGIHEGQGQEPLADPAQLIDQGVDLHQLGKFGLPYGVGGLALAPPLLILLRGLLCGRAGAEIPPPRSPV